MLKPKCGFVGIGAYGGNQVLPFYKVKYPSLFINTATTDLESLTEVDEQYKYQMAHIGMNRFPNLVYFFIYCGCHMELYEKLSEMSEEESLQFFDELTKNHNKEYEGVITGIMLRCMLADFEQNIFRLAIRNYSNTEHVHIWTFYNVEDKLYKSLSEMIENRYSPYGVTFDYEDKPEALKIEEIKSRKPPKGKKMTNAQKIIEWRDQLSQGTEYKLQELLKGTGLTNKQFQKARNGNKTLSDILKSDKTDKKGYYKVRGLISE